MRWPAKEVTQSRTLPRKPRNDQWVDDGGGTRDSWEPPAQRSRTAPPALRFAKDELLRRGSTVAGGSKHLPNVLETKEDHRTYVLQRHEKQATIEVCKEARFLGTGLLSMSITAKGKSSSVTLELVHRRYRVKK